MPSLRERFQLLEERLVGPSPLGPAVDLPFALFVYPPSDELAVRRETDLLVTRLQIGGRRVIRVDLGDVFWECLAAHPLGPEALFEAEASTADLQSVLSEAHTLLAGNSSMEPGPLEQRVIARIGDVRRKDTVVLLERAAELFPVYRTSALLERMIGQKLQVSMVLFYPGTFAGPTEPRFMGVAEPSPNYRVTILP